MTAQNTVQRFTARAGNYARFRPGYPPAVLDLLRDECALGPDSAIADIASGTGIFTRMLLENGNQVFGVEPNGEMRHAAESFLAGFPRFVSIDGTAEGTSLPRQSVDLVTAAQAAHWFQREAALREFARILKPRGWTVLLWNERKTDSTPFLRDYENLVLTFGTDYGEVRHERTTAEIGDFFAPAPYKMQVFNMTQEFDFPALEGRLLSSSYTPPPGHPQHEPMLRELRRIFDLHQINNRVEFDYNTRVFYGILTSAPEAR